jgi:hypothetical protein
LTQDEKFEIVRTAESRKDFHDVDKIVSEPWWGRCLCELRIVAGQECRDYCRKGEDGKTTPEAKKHWVWFIDINPRGMVCPFAMQRGHERGEGDPDKWHCDILMDFPKDFKLEDWIMTHDTPDPPGTVSINIYSDMVMRGKCVQCHGKNRIDKPNKILDPDFNIPFTRSNQPYGRFPYTFPPDFDPADEEGYQPPAWPMTLAVVPMQFIPKRGKEDNKVTWYEKYHPIYRIGGYYHQRDLLHFHPKPKEEELFHFQDGKDLATIIVEFIESESDKRKEDEAPMSSALQIVVEKRRQEKELARHNPIQAGLDYRAMVDEMTNSMTRHGLFR